MATKRTPRCWVAFGETPEHLRELVLHASRGTATGWTVNEDGLPGDDVLFYFVPPLNAFVAAGTVVKPRDRRGRRPARGAARMAWVGEIQMLPTPLRLPDAKKQMPRAKWLRAAQGFARRPCPREDFDAILGLGRAGLLVYSVDDGSLSPDVEAGLARFLEESDRMRPRRP